jgi:catechol 2,3-dioxygenase-like lactoylglutathione lyase family enzyme
MAGTTEATGINRRGIAVMDHKLEVVVIPVSDVDKAKSFYQALGWQLAAPGDHDPPARPVRPMPATYDSAADMAEALRPAAAAHGAST